MTHRAAPYQQQEQQPKPQQQQQQPVQLAQNPADDEQTVEEFLEQFDLSLLEGAKLLASGSLYFVLIASYSLATSCTMLLYDNATKHREPNFNVTILRWNEALWLDVASNDSSESVSKIRSKSDHKKLKLNLLLDTTQLSQFSGTNCTKLHGQFQPITVLKFSIVTHLATLRWNLFTTSTLDFFATSP